MYIVMVCCTVCGPFSHEDWRPCSPSSSTGSCAVNLTQVDIICQSNSADVMWTAAIAGEYTAVAEDSDGNRLNCSSTTSSCQISNLPCGRQYTFSVTGTICHNQISNIVREHSGETLQCCCSREYSLRSLTEVWSQGAQTVQVEFGYFLLLKKAILECMSFQMMIKGNRLYADLNWVAGLH